MYADGVVAGFNQLEKTNDLIVAAPTGPGNSGSGVIDSDGYLVGLLYAGSIVPHSEIFLTLDLTHSFCVNSTVLKEFLKGYLD
jgi:S1-C subfamily serine protease